MAAAKRSREHGAGETVPARDRLMDAAMAYVRDQGVLGGLNLREIADAAGVTPANIYHLFGSGRGLLRAALNRDLARLADLVDEVGDLDLRHRRIAMFDALVDRPEVPLTALLALDGDPDYRPLPFLDQTVARYASEQAAGAHRGDLDLVAVHLVTLAVSAGLAIYRDAVGRQLDVDPDELTVRVRAVLEQMLDGLAP